MTKTKNEEEFPTPSFLNQTKLKKQEDKIESGETKCNIESPHECEGCGA